MNAALQYTELFFKRCTRLVCTDVTMCCGSTRGTGSFLTTHPPIVAKRVDTLTPQQTCIRDRVGEAVLDSEGLRGFAPQLCNSFDGTFPCQEGSSDSDNSRTPCLDRLRQTIDDNWRPTQAVSKL